MAASADLKKCYALRVREHAGLATFHSFNYVVPWQRDGLLELGVRIRLWCEHGVSNLRAG